MFAPAGFDNFEGDSHGRPCLGTLEEDGAAAEVMFGLLTAARQEGAEELGYPSPRRRRPLMEA